MNLNHREVEVGLGGSIPIAPGTSVSYNTRTYADAELDAAQSANFEIINLAVTDPAIDAIVSVAINAGVRVKQAGAIVIDAATFPLGKGALLATGLDALGETATGLATKNVTWYGGIAWRGAELRVSPEENEVSISLSGATFEFPNAIR
ncbi:hypothetical protein [Jannaschia sp. LMIT008]|uniref:hypothetical protein n=1 Tax=Jannaschia maritima TaxID=3032585 RepID=UPI002811F6D8|nr:hypothetical protein [Jannaschia sp. LMIT008]